jgi:hypothetical protein
MHPAQRQPVYPFLYNTTRSLPPITIVLLGHIVVSYVFLSYYINTQYCIKTLLECHPAGARDFPYVHPEPLANHIWEF